ncbi:DNA polymerase III subunit chi [Aquicella lusitana]|uniref:DNA polymerase III chi subunit n=1 Tax=Aquicella lusitana TaxID=254246 RepID=A0A370GJV4_9COXI|nr:DNA polymerase III subunit chi [Aquicella lusitana]RDI42674.1 DNA polymerase III chi subunit [Aquicella lusitana]VVC73471.1 DNA polymerase III subunit chi [Aquicella lusitana]
MATVDFYVLETQSGQQSLRFACSLIEKAYQQKQSVYVHTVSRAEAERMDKLLWTYREDSFLPHCLYLGNQPENEQPVPIQIGFDTAPPNQRLLLNLTQQVPVFYHQFQHIMEIVFADPAIQQLARERFRYYRDQGCEMNTYKIKANEA